MPQSSTGEPASMELKRIASVSANTCSETAACRGAWHGCTGPAKAVQVGQGLVSQIPSRSLHLWYARPGLPHFRATGSYLVLFAFFRGSH